ncbi:hypothetical protein PHYPSEUDO_011832 [Phytophthora pseudosyringae]|uniref:RxLR effector protein n=1 Tax=Phytophthora pseudosyringae TaxID=221518 RepID=A0A8T1VCV3_9STRA|nr:hypothetical protein PHYPSEUDO_011832 [Phytophthora pseudosyringae]
MRLSFMLPVTMVFMYVAACSATANSKISMMGSPDLVRSPEAGQNDTAGRRFLRKHKADEEEERVFGRDARSKVKKLARAMLKDSTKEPAGFAAWAAAGHTLDDIKNWLDVANRDKYLRIYNGYTFHTYQS